MLVLTAAAPAWAQAGEPASAPAITQTADDPFASLVGKRRFRADEAPRNAVERFETQPNHRVFLFENHGQSARIKFLCREDDPRLDCSIDPDGPAEEIFLLTPARGPRGDMLFKNAAGESVLRIAAHGGATVVWPGESRGKAASRVPADAGEPLTLPAARRAVAHRRAQGATAHISAMAGSPITFDIGLTRRAAGRADEERAAPRLSAADSAQLSDGSSVLADAVARVAEGVHIVARDAQGAKNVGARLRTVRFVVGEAVSLMLEAGVLTVVYDPDGELAGRPSSLDVARFLEDNL